MADSHSYLLSFPVGELSCQLLQISTGGHSSPGPPTSYLTHKHSSAELHYILQGHCTYTAGETRYELQPNQLLILPPGTEHTLTHVQSHVVRLILSLHIQPPSSRSKGPSLALFNALYASAPTVLNVRPDSTLHEALNRINALSGTHKQEFSVRESLRAYSILLMAGLSERLLGQTVSVTAPPPHLSAPHSFLIDQFFFCNSSHGGATALAQLLNVTPRQLDRILLDNYGMNFRDKMIQAKLNNALDLLSNKTLSIDQIAHLLGYSSSTAFGTFVKKETGKTPSQLRRSLLAGETTP